MTYTRSEDFNIRLKYDLLFPKIKVMKIDALKAKKTFTVKEAKNCGVSPQLLRHHMVSGLLERVSHGVYRFASDSDYDLDTLITQALKAIPQGVIGMKTALRLHGLGEELPGEIDIIVPNNNIPKRKLENIQIHPAKPEIYKEGLVKIRGIPVTVIERTLVDLLRTKESMAFVLRIYQEAKSKRINVSLTKLKKLGMLFHARQRVESFIEAVL